MKIKKATKMKEFLEKSSQISLILWEMILYLYV